MAHPKLSAAQIRELDERHFDMIGLENQLKMAMQFHANRVAEMKKAESKWWDEIIAQHDLDQNKKWQINHIEGAVCIEEVETKED